MDEHGEQVPTGEKVYSALQSHGRRCFELAERSERYESTYFSTVSKQGVPVYFSGDGAYRDEDGYIVITGRVDDVINISGHRVGTAEVESVVAGHPAIAEAAVVTKPTKSAASGSLPLLF